MGMDTNIQNYNLILVFIAFFYFSFKTTLKSLEK